VKVDLHVEFSLSGPHKVYDVWWHNVVEEMAL
jgi:hypothetical protein